MNTEAITRSLKVNILIRDLDPLIVKKIDEMAGEKGRRNSYLKDLITNHAEGRLRQKIESGYEYEAKKITELLTALTELIINDRELSKEILLKIAQINEKSENPYE